MKIQRLKIEQNLLAAKVILKREGNRRNYFGKSTFFPFVTLPHALTFNFSKILPSQSFLSLISIFHLSTRTFFSPLHYRPSPHPLKHSHLREPLSRLYLPGPTQQTIRKSPSSDRLPIKERKKESHLSPQPYPHAHANIPEERWPPLIERIYQGRYSRLVIVKQHSGLLYILWWKP